MFEQTMDLIAGLINHTHANVMRLAFNRWQLGDKVVGFDQIANHTGILVEGGIDDLENLQPYGNKQIDIMPDDDKIQLLTDLVVARLYSRN